MDSFDFSAPAELFCGDVRGRKRSMSYQRFTTGADAVRHVMEQLQPQARSGAVIETEHGRFEFADIEQLYARPDYPLGRGH